MGQLFHRRIAVFLFAMLTFPVLHACSKNIILLEPLPSFGSQFWGHLGMMHGEPAHRPQAPRVAEANIRLLCLCRSKYFRPRFSHHAEKACLSEVSQGVLNDLAAQRETIMSVRGLAKAGSQRKQACKWQSRQILPRSKEEPFHFYFG